VAAYGEMMQNGQMLAVEEINKLTNHERKVEINFYNTSHKKDIALEKLKEVYHDNIRFVVELFGSDQLDHCLNYAKEKKILILSGVDTRPDLVKNGGGFFYRIMPNDTMAASVILQWVKDMDISKIAIVYANDAWGNGLKDAAVEKAMNLNISIVEMRDIEKNQPSYAAPVIKIKESGAEAVLLFVYPDDGGNLLKEANRQQLETQFFATENFTGSDMLNTAKDAAEGVMLVIPKTNPESQKLIDFNRRYKEKFKSEPTIFAIKGFDAVMLLYSLVEKHGEDTQLISQNLRTYKGEGLSGQIAFDSTGEFDAVQYDRLKFVREGTTYQLQPIPISEKE
jgi:branched-chain amino acid transport system substrate-binding protein